MRAWRATPRLLQLGIALLVLVALWAAANAVYHALRKPTELLFPLSGALAKTPAQTWREYGPHFRRHATAVITPEFLAALAQIEGAGNPLARTYWRWQPAWHPFELYRPASSAVGMYQITDGTYAQSRPDCTQDASTACRWDGLYARVVPDEAIALTAAMLDRAVARTLARQRIVATPRQKQDLAAVIHLCGAGAGEAYARRRLRLLPGQRCGDHDVAAYLARLDEMRRRFARLALPSTTLRQRASGG